MATASVRTVRKQLNEMVERVELHHERVIITREGRKVAVMMNPDDLAALEETVDVLSDHQALADIREADAAYARGDVTRGINAARNLAREI